MSRLQTTALVAAVLLLPIAAWGIDADRRGLEIAEAADLRDRGFGDYQAEMRMRLIDRAGAESSRELRVRVLETPGDGDKLLLAFDSPADLSGTLMLTHSHGARPDDQWLYLPSLKRVKRIASANKSGPFMGSEFAYEDLGSQELAKYRYRWLRDEPCGPWHCHVVERLPVGPDSGYRRQVVWTDGEHYRVVKVEYYDRRDGLQKRLALSGYREYQGRWWRPDRMAMENLQTGKSTMLDWRGYRFRTGLTESDMGPEALARTR